MLKYNLSFIIILCIALAFGYWFAEQQLLVISPDAYLSYPKNLFVLTILKCTCTIFVFFALSKFILLHLSNHKLHPNFIAMSYAPLLMVYTHSPLAWILYAILTLQMCALICILRYRDYQWIASRYLTDFAALAGLFLLHLALTSLVSPLHWNMAMFSNLGFVGEEIPVQAPIYKGFSLAKQFVFSNIDYSEWASILNPPITLSSPFLQLLTFIFDLPSISPKAFHIVLSAVQFILMVGGSFGLYLFLRHALKLHPIFAFFGGCLMFFSNTPLLSHMLSDDGGVFLTCYAIFPYTLLLIALAFEKKNYLYASWAGVALASQLFFLTPHPEGILYSFLFFGIYTLGLCLFSKALSWKVSIKLGMTSFMTFGLLALYPLLPILVDQALGNAHTFAHTGDIDVNTFDRVISYLKLLAWFGPISLTLWIAQKRLTAAYLSSLFLCTVLLCFYSLTTSHLFVSTLVHVLHIGLHIWAPWRIGLFLCLTIFIISMAGLDTLTRALSTLAIKRKSNLYACAKP